MLALFTCANDVLAHSVFAYSGGDCQTTNFSITPDSPQPWSMSDKKVGDTIGTFTVNIAYKCKAYGASSFMNMYYTLLTNASATPGFGGTVATNNLAIGLTLHSTDANKPATIADDGYRIDSASFNATGKNDRSISVKFNLIKIAEPTVRNQFTVALPAFTDKITVNGGALGTPYAPHSQTFTLPSVTVLNLPKCTITTPIEGHVLPTARINDIKTGTVPWSSFKINMRNCGLGRIFTIKYSDANSPGNTSSVLTNTISDSSGAKNIGIELQGHDGNPVTLGRDIPTQITQPDGDMSVTYAARLARIGNAEPTAGDVKATAYFDLTYP